MRLCKIGMDGLTLLYTGQRALEELGIYYYNARWYDPYLNRFLSADTMVPGAADSQAYDRYSYSRNNPIKFVDPSGHYDVPSDGPPSYIENKGLYEHIEYDPFALLPQGPSLTDNGAGVLNAYMEYATQNPGATIFDFSIYVYASEFDIIVENVNCLHPHCAGLTNESEIKALFIEDTKKAVYLNYIGWCRQFYGTCNLTQNGWLNHLGAHNESAQRRYDLSAGELPPITNNDGPLIARGIMSHIIENADNMNSEHIYYLDPYDWANRYSLNADYLAHTEPYWRYGSGVEEWNLYNNFDTVYTLQGKQLP